MAPTQKRESAGEIAKRYGLADLVRTRMLARRLYLNSLTKRASISYHDSLDVFDPDMTPLELSLLNSRRHIFLNDPVRPRRGLPPLDNRYAYNRRLAEIEAERMDAEEASERLMTCYMTRAKAKKIAEAGGDKDKNDNDNTGDENNDDINELNDKDLDDDDILDEELLEPSYLDYLTDPYDPSTWRHARRLYRRRLSPYHFRPLGATTRLLERRLRGL